MPNLYFGHDLDPETFFEWTFLAKNKIKMPNLYFGDDLDPEFIPKLIPGDQLGMNWGYSLFTYHIGPNFF